MQRLLYEFRRALQSPSRNPRMAVVIGRLLGSAFVICFVTGLYSHFIQDPIPGMWFPTSPIFLYQVTQGVHITAGILCFPLIFAKLYAVYPNLFQTPPISGWRSLLERASITLFVASSLVEITSGLLNTYQWYQLFAFPFRQTHFTLAFIVIGSLAIHIGSKLTTITRYWRKRDSYDGAGELIQPQEKEPAAASDPLPLAGMTGRLFAWIDKAPEAPRPKYSRRGFIATISVAGAAVVGLTVGQSARAFDFANVFGPRKAGTGPDTLPVNRTAHAAKVIDGAMDPNWTLTVRSGNKSQAYSRKQLEAMPQYVVQLPIACVEGWSQMATWKGPRLKDVVDTVGAKHGATVRLTSLEKGSPYAVSQLEPNFARDDLTLIALEVDGEVLDIDHGYPARLIAPARPGVLQTKWLTRIEAL
jgi:DMSO/TMAO reductase YedYZ molybdopterin-dependent catalytic subunit